MANSRSRKGPYKRKENNREERKTLISRELLTFSLKDLDQTQPKGDAQTIEVWNHKGLLSKLVSRLYDLSKLTRHEAIEQKQIKIYGDFPDEKVTDFHPPKHIDSNVAWGVIEGLGGKPRVAGYIVENTFYIVFLDSMHKFWKSKKKHT